MKPKRLIALIALAGLMLLGRRVISFPRIGFTPEQAVRQTAWVECSPKIPDCVEPLGTCMAELGRAVVVFRLHRPLEGGKPQVFGIRNVRRERFDWNVTGGVSSWYLPPSPKHLIEYQYIPDGTRSSFCPMIYGRVPTPTKVAAVEVTFNNGQTLRDKTADQVFALISSKDASSAHNLRVFDVDGQVLEQIDLRQHRP
jgi:hypothetical protein